MTKLDRDDQIAIARRGAELLYRRGASRVWVFGSLAVGRPLDEVSDIDLAVEGLPQHTLDQLKRDLEGMLGCRVDLAHMETVPPRFRAVIVAQRVLLPRQGG